MRDAKTIAILQIDLDLLHGNSTKIQQLWQYFSTSRERLEKLKGGGGPYSWAYFERNHVLSIVLDRGWSAWLIRFVRVIQLPLLFFFKKKHNKEPSHT